MADLGPCEYSSLLQLLSFSTSRIFTYLVVADIKNLVLTSKAVFTTLLPFIEVNYFFHVFPQETFTIYNPQKLIIYSSTSNWSSFKHVTNITFSTAYKGDCTGLPSTLTHLKLGDSFNQPIGNSLPHSLTHISFGMGFNQPSTAFPSSLKSLIFPYDSKFTQKIEVPASVTQLAVTQVTNFPSGLKEIKFSSVHSPLPPSVTKLSLSDSFNSPLDNLPLNLLELRLGTDFNHPIDNLPPTIQLIDFTYDSKFNQSVDKLPRSLLHLEFGEEFNKPLDHLPQSLRTLKLGASFNQPLTNLPASLGVISFDALSKFNSAISYPLKLHSLDIPKKLQMTPEELPSSLRSLWVSSKTVLKIKSLPSSLLTLNTNGFCTQYLESFPSTLRSLTLLEPFQGPLHTIPPTCVVTLKSSIYSLADFPEQTRHTVKIIHASSKIYPNHILASFTSITSIQFAYMYDSPLPVLPDSVMVIEMGDRFRSPLTNLPPNLKQLHLGSEFNHPLSNLPASLQVLHVGKLFTQPLDSLPQLRQLVLCNSHYPRSLSSLPLSLVEIATPLETSSDSYKSIPPPLQQFVCTLKFYSAFFSHSRLSYHINNYSKLT